jgi:hypothetical protein
VFTGDASEVSIAVLGVGDSLGQHLMIIRDEPILGATDTFAAQQGAGREAAEDLKNDILCEASQCVPLARGLLYFVEPAIISV